MKIVVKLLSGDIYEIPSPKSIKHNDEFIIATLRQILNDHTNVIHIFDMNDTKEKNDEKNKENEKNEEKNKENEEKIVKFAVITPVHPNGEEYITFLHQILMCARSVLYFKGNDTTDIITKWVAKCRESVANDGVNGSPTIEQKNTIIEYLSQFPLFITKSGMRGDTCISKDGSTCIELYADIIQKCYSLVGGNDFSENLHMAYFQQLLDTQPNRDIMVRLVARLFSTCSAYDHKYNDSTIDHFLHGKGINAVAKMLRMIGLFNQPSNLFEGLYNIFDGITYDHIKSDDDETTFHEKFYRHTSSNERISLLKKWIDLTL